MKTDIVVFKNEFNTVPLRNFTATEMDLLFTIMSQMRDEGLTKITFDYEDLKELSNYQPTATERFEKDLERTYDKLIQLNVKIGNDRKWTKFVFFTEYTLDKDNQQITIGVNSKFEHLINELTGNFTKLELEEVTELRSSYSKSMYRLLKQFRSTGLFIISIEDFRNLLDVPDSYKMPDIRRAVFKPIQKELPQYFPNLKIEEVKGRGKEKRKTVKLNFYFDKENTTSKDKDGRPYATFIDEEGKYYNKYLDEVDLENSKKPKKTTQRKKQSREKNESDKNIQAIIHEKILADLEKAKRDYEPELNQTYIEDDSSITTKQIYKE